MTFAKRIIGFLSLVLLFALTAPPVRDACAQSDPSIITSIRSADDESGFELTFDIRGRADPKVVLLRQPYRVVLDLENTLTAAKLPDFEKESLIAESRQGLIGEDRYRLVLELAEPARPELTVTTTEKGEARVALRLTPATDSDFAMTPAAPTKAVADSKADDPGARPFVIVLDPGHGGVDKGATGEKGTEEKAVNLAFGKALRDALRTYRGIKVVMTREEDIFIPLNERAAIARRAGANLLISLHADSIRYRDLRGATVYTLSEKASDNLARELADTENAADRFAGPEWDQDAPEIHDILVDLVRRETEGLSEHFAIGLVADLRDGDIRLINNPKRSAGFRVLRAPDVPSILLEMGYLSNAEDEQLLNSADWQKRLAKILASSIAEFSGRAAKATERSP